MNQIRIIEDEARATFDLLSKRLGGFPHSFIRRQWGEGRTSNSRSVGMGPKVNGSDFKKSVQGWQDRPPSISSYTSFYTGRPAQSDFCSLPLVGCSSILHLGLITGCRLLVIWQDAAAAAPLANVIRRKVPLLYVDPPPAVASAASSSAPPSSSALSSAPEASVGPSSCMDCFFISSPKRTS